MNKKLRIPKSNTKRLIVVMVIFALVGVGLLIRSRAATGDASIEAENGTIVTPAMKASDANASGGQYLKFTGTTASSITLPARAAFYYPWFPETWTVNGAHVFYNPLLGYYDSSAQSVVDSHIKAMDYAKINVAIASWWGKSTHSENTRIPQILSRTQALGSSLKWGFYYEKEGSTNPTVAEIQADLAYIRDTYASNPAFARVGGKPVIFVYNADDTTCEVADRWKQANQGYNFYIALKVFTGYKTCTSQPDSWHQYAPSQAADSQAGYSYAISPGFWRADEAAPRLARDLTRWQSNVGSMVASKAPWQLVTTFNEWGEGTATEAAQDWSSA